MKTVTTPIVIGTLGIIKKGTEKHLELNTRKSKPAKMQ